MSTSRLEAVQNCSRSRAISRPMKDRRRLNLRRRLRQFLVGCEHASHQSAPDLEQPERALIQYYDHSVFLKYHASGHGCGVPGWLHSLLFHHAPIGSPAVTGCLRLERHLKVKEQIRMFNERSWGSGLKRAIICAAGRVRFSATCRTEQDPSVR